MPLQVRWIAVRVFFPAVFLLALALPGSAQDLAAREQLLRQRVEGVYRLFVTGAWRQVEQYVSEDTRDLWFGQAKSTIDSFELGEIKIDPDGQRALVTVKATFRVLQSPGQFTMPQIGEWLFEEGQWFLKIRKPPTLFEMFGTTTASSSTASSSSGAPLASPQQSPFAFDQSPVLLPNTAGSSEIVVKVLFRNVSSNRVTVQELSTTCECLKAEMDKRQLNPQEQAFLTVTYQNPPGHAPPLQMAVRAIVFTPAVYQMQLPVLLQDQ